MLREPLVSKNLIDGLRDHLAILSELRVTTTLPPVPSSDELNDWIAWVFQAEKTGPHPLAPANASEADWWLAETHLRIGSITTLICDYLPWLSPQFSSLQALSSMQC